MGFEKEQDFDQHGSDPSSHHTGGFAGDYTEMLSNTFLGDDHRNVEIRGIPCRSSTIAGNVFTQFFSIYDTSNFWNAGGTTRREAPRSRASCVARRSTSASFGSATSTETVAPMSSRCIPSARSTSRGAVSRRGARSPPRPPRCLITSFTIGNFDGDRLHGDDVFMTNGCVWFVAPSGLGWAPVGSSSFPMSRLRFGDFDGDGSTDVLGVNGGAWSISSAARGPWTSLGGISTSTLDGLFVADLDGDGIADVAKDGGRFQGGLREDLLWWSDEVIDIGPGLTAPATRWSRQDMR